MSKTALQLACRFSLPPNSLGYCGKDSAPEKFKRCVLEGDCTGIEEELANFIVLNPYLETLAAIMGKHKFSREVIEAYWLGGEGLKKAKVTDYQLLLDNFIRQGVPGWFVQELRTKVPGEFIPNHLFQVLHVGVGRASGSVPYNIDTINNCMIRWGRVTKVEVNYLQADLNLLDNTEASYKLICRRDQASLIPGFIPELGLGDTVAVHWNQAVKKLTSREVSLLTNWTNGILASLLIK